MNILHVSPGLNVSFGGPPHGLRSLALVQLERGHRVSILACSGPPGEKVLPPGANGNLSVTIIERMKGPLLPDREVTGHLNRLIAEADIVHIHGTWRYHCWGAGRIARRRGVPYIVRPAGNLGEVPRAQKSLVKGLYWRLLDRTAVNHAAAVHCCSEKERREIAGLGVRSPLRVVPMPLDGRLLGHEPDMQGLVKLCPPLSDGRPMVLFLGRLAPIKRTEVLMEAFRRLANDFPDVVLMFAGPGEKGEIVQGLKASAAEAGLTDRVCFPGMVTGGIKAACFRRATVFALPSAHENFGQSVAEALAFEVPSVVSDGVALADEIEQNGAGLRCPSEPAAFEEALRRLLSDAALRQSQAGAAGRLSRQFMPDTVHEQLMALYESCRG